jgi:hypothetical protein
MNNSSLQLVVRKSYLDLDFQEFADAEVKVNDFHEQDDLFSSIISRL